MEPPPSNATNLLNDLLNALTGGVVTNSHGLYNTMDNDPNTILSGDLGQFFTNDENNHYTTAAPEAFLNYMAFDNQLNMVSTNSGVVQVPTITGSEQAQPLVAPEQIIQKDDYLYIYVSNESAQKVFFDNLVIHHNRGPILQMDNYYPFGLTMARISDEAALSLENKFLYNGIELNHKEFSDGTGLELYTAHFRGLDPQIGRWWQIDPKPDYDISPYSAMDLDPIIHIDPLGDTTIINRNQENRKQFINLLNNESSTKFSINKQGDLEINGKPDYKTQKNQKSGLLAQTIVSSIKSKKNIYLNLVNNDPNVFFDSYKNAKFDVGDFEKISKFKGFTAALIGHVFTERTTAPKFNSTNNSLTDFSAYHNAAKIIEASILYDMRGQFYAPLYRNESLNNGQILFFRFKSVGFDYGQAKYDIITDPDMNYILGALKIK